MRHRTDWQEIFGKDADLLNYCRRRGAVTPTLDIIIDFLDSYEVRNDPEFLRPRLPKTAKLWLERLAAWRFGYQTFSETFPTLSYWCERLDVSRKHLIRVWRFLVRQGLLVVPEGHKPGRALRFGVDALLGKIRAWLSLPQPQEEEEQESMGAWAPIEPQPEPWAEEGEKEPIPFPVPEPEPEPLPVAAFVTPAVEWDMALPAIEREVDQRDYLQYFARLKAFWIDGKLTIRTRDKEQWSKLQTRFRHIINRNLAGYDVVILGPARSAS